MNPTPRGLQSPRRAALLVPIGLAILVALGIVIFSLSHLTAKKPAPQLDATSQEAAQGQTERSRGPYGASDFTEPDLK